MDSPNTGPNPHLPPPASTTAAQPHPIIRPRPSSTTWSRGPATIAETEFTLTPGITFTVDCATPDKLHRLSITDNTTPELLDTELAPGTTRAWRKYTTGDRTLLETLTLPDKWSRRMVIETIQQHRLRPIDETLLILEEAAADNALGSPTNASRALTYIADDLLTHIRTFTDNVPPTLVPEKLDDLIDAATHQTPLPATTATKISDCRELISPLTAIDDLELDAWRLTLPTPVTTHPAAHLGPPTTDGKTTTATFSANVDIAAVPRRVLRFRGHDIPEITATLTTRDNHCTIEATIEVLDPESAAEALTLFVYDNTDNAMIASGSCTPGTDRHDEHTITATVTFENPRDLCCTVGVFDKATGPRALRLGRNFHLVDIDRKLLDAWELTRRAGASIALDQPDTAHTLIATAREITAQATAALDSLHLQTGDELYAHRRDAVELWADTLTTGHTHNTAQHPTRPLLAELTAELTPA
ncbi:hypothetical protein [Corynebacterium meridianum]|uniref:Uncharacterized protein n=1 Tax=Corynebacterium meridianum TaxID=2765363 RepID=A0A934I403_9CORY|nr:hypothetical protein [Corynebacterium meridianum]MBI8988155.1 hypothetical protein [Corynebacterium meridianum]